MRKIVVTLILLAFAGTAVAQSLAAVSGIPMPKKSTEPFLEALVTFTSEWDKELKYQRKTDSEGFRVVLPQGGYLLTVEADGYETYTLEIEVDQPNIDLEVITMLTLVQAKERDIKRKRRHLP